MSLPGCAVGALIEWPVMRELAERVDALAVALNTPDYVTLLSIEDAPFQFEDKVEAPGPLYQSFNVSGGSVVSRRLSSDPTGIAPYVLPNSALDNLIDHDELYFIADADDCLCKTLYKVERVSGGHTLTYAGDPTGCCQTLDLPENGNALLSKPHLFPTYFTLDLINNGMIASVITKRACVDAADAIATFVGGSPVGDRYPLIRATRSLKGGYFTWPFKKRYLNLIIEKLNFILECERNDGIAPAGPETAQEFEWMGSTTTLWVHGELYNSHEAPTFNGWFKTGSTCPTRTVDQWFASLWRESFYDEEEPGNLVFGQPPELVSSGKPDDGARLMFTRPWNAPTPESAEACDPPDLPKVYAYTLNSLDLLVEKLEDRVWPYGTFDPPAAIMQCDDEDTVHCCGFPDINFATSREDCARAGGTPTTDYEACCSSNQAKCDTQQGSNCGAPIDCTWDSFLCMCDCPEVCIESFTCCCGPSPGDASDVCKSPASSTDLGSCPEGCVPALTCTPVQDTICCYADGTPAETDFLEGCPDGVNGPTFPCLGDWYAQCSGIPSSYPVSYVVPPLLPPEYPDLPTCEKPCCLTHPVFRHGPKDCLQYFSELEAFLLKATDGMFNNCRHKDLRYVDPENPETSAVRECETIACGQICQEDYEILIATPEHPVITCLDQAPMMYTFDRRKVLPNDDSLLDYYDILITAPTTF